MSNTITGKEVATTTFDNDGKVVEWGESIYGKTLRGFMCAIVQGMAAASKTSLWTPQEIAYKAETLTTAYLNKLNEQQ